MSEGQILESSTTEFLDVVASNCPGGRIPVRTEWVGKVLENNGYATILNGDPAWYHPEYIGESFHKPESIDQLVFTPPHNTLYKEQAKRLVAALADRFPNAERIISFHFTLDENDRKLREFADKKGYNIRYTSHDADNLEFYRNSDLHVGYLKHGHLAHLRLRRPSVVLAEDSRAMGLQGAFMQATVPAFEPRFPNTAYPYASDLLESDPGRAVQILLDRLPTGVDFEKWQAIARPNPDATQAVTGFVDDQLEQDWEAYDDIGEKIDRTYQNAMQPYIKSIFD